MSLEHLLSNSNGDTLYAAVPTNFALERLKEKTILTVFGEIITLAEKRLDAMKADEHYAAEAHELAYAKA